MPAKNRPIRILHFGLGAVGRNIARMLQGIPGLESAAAVDLSPTIFGRNLHEVLSENCPNPPSRLKRILVQETLPKKKTDVTIHATRSWLRWIAPELQNLLRSGLNVISTAEELVFPVGKNIKIAQHLDRLAKRNKVRILGVGINPGFVLDFLPVILSLASTRISHISAERIVDLRFRRLQLQKKVGVGMTAEEFQQSSKSVEFGHQGMFESLAFLAEGAAIPLTKMKKAMKPLIAEKTFETEFLTVKPGQVVGIEQTAIGFGKGQERIRMLVRMAVGEGECQSRDQIILRGNPDVTMQIPGGIAGEAGTAATLINSIVRLLQTPPGFHTLLDLLPRKLPL